VTVELTVKPLKTDENVGTSENNKNDARRLKRPEESVEQAEKESETPPAKSGLILSQSNLIRYLL